MEWKTFFKILLLMIIGAILFYLVYPKYYFTTSDSIIVMKGNKITGQVSLGNKIRGLNLPYDKN